MQQAKPKSPYLGLIIIGGTLIILILILVVVMGIFFVGRQLSSDQTRPINPFVNANPLNQINVDDIDPALALASLGGLPQSDVILEALDKARPETALAVLLFHPTLTNKESAGGFLQLAAVYAENDNRRKAGFSLEMACTIATLAPDISDTVRADVFIEAGEGLIELDNRSLAKFCLDQAFIVAFRSPFLQAAHRRAIFEKLHKNYIILGARTLARESLTLSANPPSLALFADERTVLPDSEAVPLSQAIQEAEANRWLAAQQLAVLLVERGGNAPQESIEALAEVLVIEDQQKLPYYAREIANTTQLSKKIDFTLAQIDWLSAKHRVARRGYGLSIVPEWETEAEQIRADLTKAYENLFTFYADLAIALPVASKIDKATEEQLRSEILAGELGRYPNYPQEQRRKQLLDATDQLVNTQPEISIFVGIGADENEDRYTLIFLE
jgi:hypothetical protein